MPSVLKRNRVACLHTGLAAVTIAACGLAGSPARAASLAPRPDPDPDYSRVMHRYTEPVSIVFTDNETRSMWSDPTQSITEEFDVYVGSDIAGTDGMEIDRKAAEWNFRDFGDSDKRIVTVVEGYAIASGTAPILGGRRIRAASDGTQFAIEVCIDPTDPDKRIERVYFLNTATGRPLMVRIFPDADQKLDQMEKEIQLTLPGQYLELKDGTDLPDGPSGTISGKDVPKEVAYFAGQMYLLLTSKYLLIEPPKISEETKVAAPKDIAALIKPERRIFDSDRTQTAPHLRRTLMSRFFDRIEAQQPKDGGTK